MVSMEVQKINRMKLEEVSERLSKNKATQLVAIISQINNQLALMVSNVSKEESNRQINGLIRRRNKIMRSSAYNENIYSYTKDDYEWKLRIAIEKYVIDANDNNDITLARQYIDSISATLGSIIIQYEDHTPLDEIDLVILHSLDFTAEEIEVLRRISKQKVKERTPIEKSNDERIISLRKDVYRNTQNSYELDLRYAIKKYISNTELNKSDICNVRGYVYLLEGNIEQANSMIGSVVEKMKEMNLTQLEEYYKEYGEFIKHFQYFSDIVSFVQDIKFNADELEILKQISQYTLELVSQK